MQFFKEGRIEIPCGHYAVTFCYNEDYSFFNDLRITEGVEKSWAYENRLIKELGLPSEEKNPDAYPFPRNDNHYTSWLISEYFKQKGDPNWWNIMPDDEVLPMHKRYCRISDFNVHRRLRPDGQFETLPIDWRLTSAVWRKHYKNYFQ